MAKKPPVDRLPTLQEGDILRCSIINGKAVILGKVVWVHKTDPRYNSIKVLENPNNYKPWYTDRFTYLNLSADHERGIFEDWQGVYWKVEPLPPETKSLSSSR